MVALSSICDLFGETAAAEAWSLCDYYARAHALCRPRTTLIKVPIMDMLASKEIPPPQAAQETLKDEDKENVTSKALVDARTQQTPNNRDVLKSLTLPKTIQI